MKRIFSILLCAILLCSTLFVGVSAAEIDFPSIPSVEGYPYAKYFIIDDSGNSKYKAYIVYSTDNSIPSVTVEQFSDSQYNYTVTANADCIIYQRELPYNTSTWQNGLKQSKTTVTFRYLPSSVVYSDFDILNTDGSVFFASTAPDTGGDSSTVTLRGGFVFNDTLDIDGVSFKENIDFYFGVGSNLSLSSSNGIEISNGTLTLATIGAYKNGSWTADWTEITIPEAQVSQEFYDWFIANTTETTCDGSSCLVGDSNGDGYCEDCFMMMMSVAPEQGATYPSHLPQLPSDDGYWRVVYQKDGETYLVSELNAYGSFYGKDDLSLWHNKQATTYVLLDNEWDYYKSSTVASYVCDMTDIVWSSQDIYFENGELFFPLPLWAQVLGVTEREMERETVPTMTNSAVSLVVCGIGCLVLLISLVLLVRVLRKYLKR